MTRCSWPWMMCGVLLLATLLNYMDRQALAVTLPTLKKEFHLGERRIGMVEGCFGYAFAFGSLLFGFLADRSGPRYLYPIVLAGWSFAGIATSLAGERAITSLLESPSDDPGAGVYRWLLFCRVLLGIFEAGHWPCAMLTVRAILATKDRTLGNGILQSGASLGAIIVPLYIEAAERAGQSWQFPFWSIGLVGLLWVPIWLLLVRGRDLQVDRVPIATAAGEPNEYENLYRKLIVLAIVVASLTISWQFLRAWLGLFLQDHHHFSKIETRGLMSGYFIAADIGCVLSGLLVRQLMSRGRDAHSARTIGFIAFAFLTACGAVVPFAGNGTEMILLLCVTGAGILGLHPYYYSMTQELPAKHIGKLSGALAAFGWVVSSQSQIWLGAEIERTKSYEIGLLMVGLVPMLGAFAMVLLWPRRAKEA